MKKKTLIVLAVIVAICLLLVAWFVIQGIKPNTGNSEKYEGYTQNQLEFTMEDYSYGETACEPKITVQPSGKVTVSYFYQGINGTHYESQNAPNQIGEYAVTGTSAQKNGYLSASYVATFCVTGDELEFRFPTYATVNVGQTLAYATLSAGQGDGSFVFADVNQKFDTVGTYSTELIFMPNDTRFAPKTTIITVRVEQVKVTELNVVWPTATAISFGEKLSDSELVGGAGNGSFQWVNPDMCPTVTNNGYRVVYVPNDTDACDYSDVNLTKTIDLKVHKAEAPSTIVFPKMGAISEGQSLADSHMGGEYTTIGGYFEWKDPDQVLTVGVHQCVMVFYKDVVNYDYLDTTPTIEAVIEIEVN